MHPTSYNLLVIRHHSKSSYEEGTVLCRTVGDDSGDTIPGLFGSHCIQWIVMGNLVDEASQGALSNLEHR